MRLKFRIKIVEKWRFSFWVALFISLSLIGTAAAYYTDRERGGSDGSSVPLDFILEATSWELAADASDLDPGESVTKTIRVVDDASFSTPFKYGVKTVPTAGDLAFCAALQLEASMDGVPAYTGPLLDFDFWPVTFDPAGSLWTMRVFLPADASVNDGESCEFNFLYQGWQERFSLFPQGYHDEEVVSDRLATTTTPPPIIGCSPGFWKNHQEIWFDPNDPADVALLEDLYSRGPGSGERRLNAAITLNTEFPEIAAECGEDLSVETGSPRGEAGATNLENATSMVDLITNELSSVETEVATSTTTNADIEVESSGGGGEATAAEPAAAPEAEPALEPAEELAASEAPPEVEAATPAEEAEVAEPEPEPESPPESTPAS